MRKSLRQFLKNLALFAIVIFLAFNWQKVFLLFNYRLIRDFTSDAMQLYPQKISGDSVAEKIAETIREVNTIEIPNINIEAPIVMSKSAGKDELLKDLDLGVVHYPGSALPGEKGETILLGHSAPEGWPIIKHDWVFSNIEDLKIGEKIVIRFSGKEYTYKVTGTKILNIGEEINIGSVDNANSLVLISCWPPGKNYKRIAVQARLDRPLRI